MGPLSTNTAMEVQFSVTGRTLHLHLTPDEEDLAREGNQCIAKTTAEVELTQACAVTDLHPDHLALIAILVSHPFVATELDVGVPVSERFRQGLAAIRRYSISFERGEVTPYVAGPGSRPGLAFSGGVDSAAALLLMPDSTVPVFLDRPARKLRRSLYNKSAAYACLDQVEGLGWTVVRSSSDLEYLRSPIGFPTDMATAVPLIANASFLNLDSTAYGTIMESAYRVGHRTARQYMTSAHHRLWSPAFAGAGLPLNLPVAGLSEVMTTKIVMQSELHSTARSCIRGSFPNTCGNCWKCFRKNMVEHRHDDVPVTNDAMQKWMRVREVRSKLAAHPISHENVLAWALQGENIEPGVRDDLLARMEGSIRDMRPFERWLSGSVDAIHQPYREETVARILSLCSSMPEDEEAAIISHGMDVWLDSEPAQKALRDFTARYLA